jgi:glucose-6-phosphate isomerase
MSFDHYSATLLRYPELEFSLDTSRLEPDAATLARLEPDIARAFADMKKLEAGGMANPDEQRMVGHYWLRRPSLAPTPQIREAIESPLQALKDFAEQVHTGGITPPAAGRFERILLIGIGGSALGPQLIDDALGDRAKLPVRFFDNTDPAGFDRTLAAIGADGLKTTLVLVISKSGGTPETRNGMIEAKAAYDAAGLEFGAHAVAITGAGSKLDQFAIEHGFIARFPMEDWIGGRTSVMSTVGLVPAALQGLDIDALLRGAAAMDEKTRQADATANAAMRLALCWHAAGHGRGEKDMVVLPYKDSLVLFSKYLQQLVMESLGKKQDLDGRTVHQGLAVYGNKGSTDQHAYVQQLRDGIANFFAVFIEVRQGREGDTIEVEPGSTSADYLQGFLRGTRQALHESGRPSITLSIPRVDAFQIGLLIALFERAVSFYASLVRINAYHQPGVEAGKLAAAQFLEILHGVRSRITADAKTAADIAYEIDADPEDVYHCLTHLAANAELQVAYGREPKEDTFSL